MNPPPRSTGLDLLWVVPLGWLVVAGSFFTNLAEEHAGVSDRQPWLAAALGLLAVVGLFVSLRWPLRGAVTTFGAVTLFVVADVHDGPVYFTLAGAAFLVAVRVPVARWARVVAVGAAAVCAALVLRALADYDNERSMWQLLGVLAVCAAGAAAGTLVRNRGIALVERARAAAVQEQLRMAQDLHDGVGHGLAVIAMQAGVGLHVLERDPAAARGALEAIRDSARESLDALRAELAQVSGDAPPRRPRSGLAELEGLVGRVRSAGLDVEVSGSAGALPEPVDAVAFAVVQEGLTNVLRHASAGTAQVRLDRSPDRLAVVVEDDGRGTPGRPAPEGMGLRGMRERVQALGGELSAGPAAAGGFVVRAVLPL